MVNYGKILRQFFKGYDREFLTEFERLLTDYHKTFAIDTDLRLAIFLANVKAEVDVRHHKVVMREIMNYSAERLKVPFRIFRLHPEWAEKWGRTKYHKANEQMIANIAYAGRLGNSKIIKDGDGWRYRGAGILQDTGQDTIFRDLRFLEKKLDIKLINRITGEVYDGFLDSYTGGILLGMAHWFTSGMWRCKDMDCAVNIINRYTDSRAKRKKFYNQVRKIIRNG